MNEGLHAHVWTVTAYWRSENFRDGRMLKGALRTLLDAPPLVERYRRAAAERAAAVYSWETVTDAYEALFAQVLA